MKKTIHFFGKLTICLSLLWLAFSSSDAYILAVNAQSTEDPWTNPVNLSESGGTKDPLIVIDTIGITHVVWEDAFNGTVYSKFENSQWSEPLAVTFPFSNPVAGQQPGGQGVNNQPVFIVDGTGRIYAFWTDINNQLYVGSVASDLFGNPGGWTPTVQLAESALDFDVVVDERGTLHVAYVRALDNFDFPSGVYYRNSQDGGLSWSVAEGVYNSPYYRSLTTAEANVDIEYNPKSDPSELYLVWDHRPRRQVLFSRSQDGGDSWEKSRIIASPSETSPTINPLNIKVINNNSGILLLWQSGDPAVSCVQYYQTSIDSGSTWSEPLEMLQNYLRLSARAVIFPTQ